MKLRNLVLVSLPLFLAVNAFASRARNMVTGSGDGGVVLGSYGSSGSFYTDDPYNMFYNPVYVNNVKNWAVIEKSNYYGDGYTANTAAGKSAEGGAFFQATDNLVLGAYFNRAEAIRDAVYAGDGTTVQNMMRPIEFMAGGDMGGAQWGLGVDFSSYRTLKATDNSTKTNSYDVVLKAGFAVQNFEPFVQWRAMGTDNATGNINKMIAGGFRYHAADWVPYAVYKSTQYDGLANYRAYGVGIGRTQKMSDSFRLDYGISYFKQIEGAGAGGTPLSGAAGFNGTTTLGSRTVVPVNFAIEGDVLSWMTLRAGLGYNPWDQVGGSTAADDTSGAIGATIHLAKFDFDFAAGKAANGNETASANNAGVTSQNFDFASGLFTAASLAYKW